MNLPAATAIVPIASDREVSESAFEFLLAEILLQPAYLQLNSVKDKSDVHLHLLDILGYDVGFRYDNAIDKASNKDVCFLCDIAMANVALEICGDQTLT